MRERGRGRKEGGEEKRRKIKRNRKEGREKKE